MKNSAGPARWALATFLALAALPALAGTAPKPPAKAVPAAPEDSADSIDVPDVPEPPEPPEPPDTPNPGESVKGVTVRAGETHKGNIFRLLSPAVDIEGTQDGDLTITAAPLVRISGVVNGDVFVAGSKFDLTGTIKKSARIAAGDVTIDGPIDGNLSVTCGNLVLGSKAHIRGNVECYSGQFVNHGTIDGTMQFTGGTIVLGGKVGGNAEITADAIQIEKGARIDGSVAYSTRNRIDEPLKAIAGGTVTYDERPAAAKKKKDEAKSPLHFTRFGIGKWIAFLLASYLFGCALIAIFRSHEAAVIGRIRSDALRSFGIGFVSVLVTIAVILSLILILTIPFVIIYVLAYLVLWYLARVPVAIWLGRVILDAVGRPASPYVALLVGLIPLHLAFQFPYLGPILHWCVMPLLGVGAMITTYLEIRQVRKAAAAMPPPPDIATAASAS